MRFWFGPTAVICGLILLPMASVARQANYIKLVPTVIGVTTLDHTGRPLRSPDGVIQLVLCQFGKKEWPENYWARLTIHTEMGEALVPTRFPVDSSGIQRLAWFSKVCSHHNIKIGFFVLDGQGRPFSPVGGVQIVLTQIGERPWPDDLRVTIQGNPDNRGHVLAQVSFPLDKIIVNNLVLMAKSREK